MRIVIIHNKQDGSLSSTVRNEYMAEPFLKQLSVHVSALTVAEEPRVRDTIRVVPVRQWSLYET